MKKSPAFQFYATDYLGSQRVQLLTLEEEGAYIRLLCFCWQHGSIPSKPSEIARLVGKGCSSNLARVVAGMFEQHPTDSTKMVHERLEKEKSKQADWKGKCSEGGRKSAELRKSHPRVVALPLQLPYQDSTHSSSSSSSSSSNAEREGGFPEVGGKPTLTEVKAWASIHGLGSWKAEDFWHEMEGCGWLDHQGRAVQNWQSVLTRVKTKWEADGRPKTPPVNRQSKSTATAKPIAV